MNKSKAKEIIVKLSKEIEKHNIRYYVNDQPTVSDQEYDSLLKQLIDIEEQYPDLKKANSPTQRVGTKVASGSKTVEHKKKMLSLDNTYSLDDLNAWDARIKKGLGSQKYEYVVELKIDGISASLVYENGSFLQGATRGDGATGEDVTHNLMTVKNVPLELNVGGKAPKLLDVRCEIYMADQDFAILNQNRKKEGLEVFANPRNATSGSVKLLDSRITSKRNLKCFVHSFGLIDEDFKFKTHWDFLSTAKKWGMPINKEGRICGSIDEVMAYCHEYQEKRDTLGYEVDGVVIKVNSLKQQEALGSTLKSPRWAVSYKFQAYQATTVIESIDFQVGRTGVLTPVANLKPVECGGVTISRATLHNFDEIKRLKVAKGDRVLLERAGDVIPKIIKVVEKKSGVRQLISVPKTCPECAGKIEKDKDQIVAYRCINPSCPKQLERKIIHFSSRGAMDIDGLGESIVSQLLKVGLVSDLADLYSLKKQDLLKLDLFAEKKAENLIQSLEKSKSQPLSRVLFGMGILHVGEKAAAVLAQEYLTIERLIQAKRIELEDIKEIGEVMADSIVTFFKDTHTKEIIKKFKNCGLSLEEKPRVVNKTNLSDKKFVFTGELSQMSRSDAGRLVKDLGAEVVSSVSKNTDYVIVGKSPGSKFEKAKKLGVNILNEKQFKELINESS